MTTTTTPIANPEVSQTSPRFGFALGRNREHLSGTGRASFGAKAAVFVVCLLWFVPVFGLFVTSWRTKDSAQTSGWWNVFIHPGQLGDLTTGNYTQLFNDQVDLGGAFVNSVAIALPATFIPLLVAAFAAYAFAFMPFPGKDVLFIIIVSMLVVPNYVSFVPLLKLYGSLGISGTFPAVWLAHIGFGMSLAIYILRNYMATLPKEIMESAKVDGASHFTTFWRLIIPMSVPALASIAIFQFLWVWNDLLVALVFSGGDNRPITIAVNQLMGQQGQGIQLVTAGGFFSMLVPLIVFLGLQRFFVRGLTAGSVKG